MANRFGAEELLVLIWFGGVGVGVSPGLSGTLLSRTPDFCCYALLADAGAPPCAPPPTFHPPVSCIMSAPSTFLISNVQLLPRPRGWQVFFSFSRVVRYCILLDVFQRQSDVVLFEVDYIGSK
ncbi:hypothetical protein CDAR_194871 [Caerostris darwini]|uniref:Secreted protein n=1 Tax=Caerostris darwini TaxID=1538125 RepID=A0AAV4X7K6_9ARAC|nr:hypothetical protein CDAR_194871 [Caerostris darwini]